MKELTFMQFFIDNIYLLIIIITFSIIFFLRRQNIKLKKNKSSSPDRKVQAKLVAFERLVILIERIQPLNMINRLPVNKLNNSSLKTVLIKNIISEFDYNVSQQIYVSDNIWESMLLIKNKLINQISSISDSLDEDDSVAKFTSRLISSEQSIQSLINKTRKMIRFEVENLK